MISLLLRRFSCNALPSLSCVLLDNGRRVGPAGIRMFWGSVYRPRARQRSAWDQLWPLTPLSLSNTPGTCLPLRGSLFTCSARPSMSCGPLAARRFHCLFFSDLSARSHSRTPSFNAPSHYLLPCAVWLTDPYSSAFRFRSDCAMTLIHGLSALPGSKVHISSFSLTAVDSSCIAVVFAVARLLPCIQICVEF